MQKILSIKPTQMLSGLTAYKENSNYGIWYDAKGLNPAISGGSLSLSQSPVDISGGIVADVPIAFLGLGECVYAYGNAGKIYKITNPTATPPTVSLVHTNSQTPATWGFESITTIKTGKSYIAYFALSQIGLWSDIDGASTFNDSWKATNSRPHPTYKVADRIYFGSGNYLGMIYDDTVNDEPAILAGTSTDYWFALAKGEDIHSLSHDGTYLIIGADAGGSAKLETIIYFYDADNHYDFALKRLTIQDKLVKLYTKKGITYALCTNGLWAFTLGSAPQKVSEAITGAYGTPNIIDESVDALLIGGNTVVQSFGKLSPEFPNARFNPISDVQGYVTALYSQVSNTRAFIGASGKIYYCDYYTQRVCTDDIIKSAYLDFSSYISIDQIDLIFQDALATGDSAQVTVRAVESGVDGVAYSVFSTITNDGAVNSATSVPLVSSGKVVTDKASLEITLNGVPVIKQIDIYGSPKVR